MKVIDKLPTVKWVSETVDVFIKILDLGMNNR